jgi:hypothetical protein
MIRVLGNSPERIKINDLSDVIYYRQQKEYTDQEYENSRDLKREIDKGRVTLLERRESLKTQPMVVSEPVQVKQVIPSSISQEDIKKAVSEVLSGLNRPASPAQVDTQDIKKIILDVMEEYKKGNKIDTQEVKNAVSEVIGNMPAAPEVKQLDPQEIKKAVAEVLSEHQTENNPDLSSILLSMIPMIADAVRQEVARIQIVSSHAVPQKTSSMFAGSEFIPTVSIEGMTSNVKGEERIASGGDVSGSLEALKRLQKKS